jgi:hypothetical protein
MVMVMAKMLHIQVLTELDYNPQAKIELTLERVRSIRLVKGGR